MCWSSSRDEKKPWGSNKILGADIKRDLNSWEKERAEPMTDKAIKREGNLKKDFGTGSGKKKDERIAKAWEGKLGSIEVY